MSSKIITMGLYSMYLHTVRKMGLRDSNVTNSVRL